MTEMPSFPVEGGCRCGLLRFRVSAPPILSSACHCTGCQRMTASAFSLSITVPDEEFAILRGETVIGGTKGSEVEHHFCPSCLTWAFSRAAMLGPFVNLRTTLLDDSAPFPPFIEMWTSEKLPWATTPAVHSFPGFPAMEEFGSLVEAYAAAGRGDG